MINEKLNKDILDLINENKTEINGMKAKLLWTNPNPTSNFPSSGETGTISLSTDDYDFIIWVCSDYNSFTSPAGNFIYFKGQNYMNFSNAIGSSGTQIFNIFRFLQRVDDKTFHISRCFKYKQAGNNTSLTYEDKTLLPMYAIGFKTGLFS